MKEGREVSGVSVVGVVGWVVIVGALLAWEGLGLAHVADGWPTVSDMLRSVNRTAFGRWLLFGLWLWLGWHLFIRGWRFFLRA